MCGKELEVVDSFKYLGVWIDRWLRGNVHLEQMVEKAEEWIGKVEWMSKVNGLREGGWCGNSWGDRQWSMQGKCGGLGGKG